VRWEQGRLDELESAVNGYVERFPRLAAFRCLLALLCCELGRVTDARSELERLAVNDFVDLPQDYLGPYCMWALSLVCTFLGDPRRAGQLYELLLPYAGRNILLTVGGGCLGSADQYLGLLAATMSRWDAAARHFDLAVEANSRMGARPALVRSRYHFAAMLLARGGPSDREKARALLDQALDTARELGMEGLEEKATALRLAAVSPVSAPSQKPSPEPTTSDDIFRKEADFWTIAYEGNVFRLKDSKGLHFIAYLLGNPNKECHVSEIMAAVEGALEAPAALPSARRAELDVSHSGLGDAGPMLDAKAKVEYRHRLSDLQSELEEARTFNDLGRVARAEQEIEFITGELARSLGLGGRDRRAASGTDRARQNLTKAIKATMKRIAKANAPLGRHLSSTIKTGIFCSYSPDPRHSGSWQL